MPVLSMAHRLLVSHILVDSPHFAKDISATFDIEVLDVLA